MDELENAYLINRMIQVIIDCEGKTYEEALLRVPAAFDTWYSITPFSIGTVSNIMANNN